MCSSSRMATQFTDFVSSPFISLFSHLVALSSLITSLVVYGLKLELWFLGGCLPFSPTHSFVVFCWHGRLF
ncbi:hypothetical protein HID58_046231 [Brassica napus]|uniref:Uncharacterized protein n=1 Tax=Brassica napus TaxID=3708 RepID=A0ABQ8AWS8_BRANA|nr:hypothetical protein HID58_046231 [Brassica napus]